MYGNIRRKYSMSISTNYDNAPNKIVVIPCIPIVELTVELCTKELKRRINKYIGRFCGRHGNKKGDIIPLIIMVMEEKEGEAVLIDYIIKEITQRTDVKKN